MYMCIYILFIYIRCIYVYNLGSMYEEKHMISVYSRLDYFA